uniref:Protein kinase domain-containing protein n=1 Tax=Panagrolaimus sp. PS1159 TaxID=55785 RepID=A0AC35FQ04_9BILA
MQCADELDCAEVITGKYVTGKKCKYILMEELGRGGYGCVFKVKPEPADGNEYAMKIEKKRENRSQAKLAMEQHIMKLIRDKLKPEQRNHFIDVIDRAKKTHFYFLVMTLVGESLADLKKSRKPHIFSAGTTYAIGLQTLAALQQLHSVGYIHRDVKPGNYAIGLGKDAKTIYILDFGIARFILNSINELKGPRNKVAFKGTIRYAPLACHRNEELGKKDDCESWLYMLADISNPDDLPWRGEKDREKVGAIKEKCRTTEGAERTFRGLHVESMKEILKYIDKLGYFDELDYEFIYQHIKKAAKAGRIDLNAPFDWELDETTRTTTTNASSDAPTKSRAQTSKMVSVHR